MTSSSSEHVIVLVAIIMVAATTCLAYINESPPERSYNVFMMTPISSASHRHIYMPMATALTERGHKVTIVSGYPAADSNPNIHYVNHGMKLFSEENSNHFTLRNQPLKMLQIIKSTVERLTHEFYEIPEIKELYNRRKEYDVFIVDNLHNEIAYPFLHEIPFITVAITGFGPATSAMVGNVHNPSYVCNAMDDYKQPMSFLDRLENVIVSTIHPLLVYYYSTDVYQRELSKIFPHLPPLVDIKRNQSLSFLNSHFSHSPPVPLLPSQIDIGGVHLKSPKPLPKDIMEFVSGNEPVVYFSFGSFINTRKLPPKFRDILVTVFSRLPYKVLWQLDTQIHNISNNVMMKPWFPQQDIIAHPNVKLFISHGGIMGTQEALYYGKPLVNLPVMFDQPRNSKRLQRSGMSVVLEWNTLTEEALYNAIEEVMTNHKYREKAEELSAIFRDQPTTAVQRAIYWTEYVIRHKGAHHLRSAALHLSWFTYLNIDVFAFLSVVTLILTLGVGYAVKSFAYLIMCNLVTVNNNKVVYHKKCE